jgi:lipopolysaccharide transport system ATP-binding protein
MYVKLAFAVIAHVDADILVVDEALAVGDAFFTQKCMRFLRSFMKTGTVLFVSHDTGSIRSLCNKAIWLEKGVVFESGSPKDVSENYLEAFYEAQQGKSTTTQLKTSQPSTLVNQVDQRQELFNSSNLRNDIEIFHFDADAPSFGQRGAEVSAVKFLDANGNSLAWIVGGEEITLKVEVIAHVALRSPIVGFYVKDKLGQNLFGDNTWLSYMDAPVGIATGQLLMAEFAFFMPRLSAGHYSITVAVADGTHSEHVQHHWVHDAISFKSETSSVSGGIFGLPMKKIKLQAGD